MKTGTQYAQEVRELRANGFNFPASAGYKLANPSDWSAGQRGAVTRAINKLNEDFDERTSDEPEQEFDSEPDRMGSELAELFFDDSAGDSEEEYDDIDFFDFDEAEDLQDEEGDTYEETT